MPDASSVSSADRRVFTAPLGHRLRMVLLGYIPLLHSAAVIAALAAPFVGGYPRRYALLAPAVLYLLPPVVCRVARWVVPPPDGRFEVSSREFLRWWFYAQWQVVFNRFPSLEEALRMVPGLYSLWLRLWGARVGALAYWSAGVTVLDRSYLEIGDRVVLGAGVSLSPHVLMPDASRRLKLLVSPIAIGSDTLVGGHALLSPGARVAPGELLPAFLRLPPFSEWRDGKRTRQGSADWLTAVALVTPSHENARE